MPDPPPTVTAARPSVFGRGLAAVRRRRDEPPRPTPRPGRWPYPLQNLVDLDYLSLQTGWTPTTRREAITRLRGTRAAQAFTFHPLVEPTWLLGRTPRSVDEWLGVLRVPGSVDSLGPLFSLERAGGTAEDRPITVFRQFLRDLRDDTVLPATQPDLELTWAEARQLLYDQARRFAQQSARTQRRARSRWDESEEQAFRDRLALVRAPRREDRSVPAVTIVLPVHNRAGMVTTAISSVIAQTFGAWELIVVDDGSTDETRAVTEVLARADGRIRVVSQARLGVSAARNRGIREGRAPFVAFIDSDNQWRPDFLEISVSAMEQYDVSLTYAGIKRHESGGRSAYIGLQASRQHLLDGLSFVDLNVLVVRRESLDEVGGFDESLRRWVDYDLVLRLMAENEALYLPIIGVDYQHKLTTVDRITTSERSTWREVVLAKHLLDWEAAARVRRVDGRISVLMQTRQDWRSVVPSVCSLLREADLAGLDVEVVIVDNASHRDFPAVLASVFAAEPRVRVHREAGDRKPALALNLAFSQCAGALVLCLSATAEGRRGWLPDLVDALRPGVAGTMSLVLSADGTVGSSGVVFGTPDAFPRSFLRGYPVEDLLRSSRTSFAAGTASALLLRAEDFLAVRGFLPHFGGSLYGVDLCLRLGAGQPVFELVVTSVLVDPKSGDDRRRAVDAEAGSAFAELWRGRCPAPDDRLGLGRAGFELTGVSTDNQMGVVPQARHAVSFSPLRGGIPVLRRRPDAPRRWALKIASPVAPRGDAWGDTFFAEDFASALRAEGQEVVVDRVEGHFRRSRDCDDVVLTLRGLAKVPPQPGALNVLWVVSHPELVSDAEIGAYDLVYAASEAWAARTTARTGIVVRTLLQATNPDRFHPALAQPDPGGPIIFVGTPRRVMRPAVAAAISAGFAPTIYGHGWDGFVDPALVKADFVPGDQVGRLYRSAGAVLNDHWEHMARDGFLSNRLFDAVAAGARVVSDRVAGIDDVFRGAVTTFDDASHLAVLLSNPSSLPQEDDLIAHSERVRVHHTFTARARTMLADVADLSRGASAPG